jgi:hypothetical protein
VAIGLLGKIRKKKRLRLKTTQDNTIQNNKRRQKTYTAQSQDKTGEQRGGGDIKVCDADGYNKDKNKTDKTKARLTLTLTLTANR